MWRRPPLRDASISVDVPLANGSSVRVRLEPIDHRGIMMYAVPAAELIVATMSQGERRASPADLKA